MSSEVPLAHTLLGRALSLLSPCLCEITRNIITWRYYMQLILDFSLFIFICQTLEASWHCFAECRTSVPLALLYLDGASSIESSRAHVKHFLPLTLFGANFPLSIGFVLSNFQTFILQEELVNVMHIECLNLSRICIVHKTLFLLLVRVENLTP